MDQQLVPFGPNNQVAQVPVAPGVNARALLQAAQVAHTIAQETGLYSGLRRIGNSIWEAGFTPRQGTPAYNQLRADIENQYRAADYNRFLQKQSPIITPATVQAIAAQPESGPQRARRRYYGYDARAVAYNYARNRERRRYGYRGPDTPPLPRRLPLTGKDSYAYYKQIELPRRKREQRMGRRYFRKQKRAYQKYMTSGVRPEIKFIDTNYRNSSISSAGSLIPASGTLLQIAQGDGPSDRAGRKIRVVGLLVKQMTILSGMNAATGTTPLSGTIVRTVFAIDKQCNGAAPPSLYNNNTGVFVDPSGTLLTSEHTLAHKCPYQNARYKILKDKVLPLRTGVAICETGHATPVRCTGQMNFWKFYKRCNFITEYDNSATTGAIGTIRSNNLFGMIDESLGSGGTSLAIGELSVRVYFTDA